MTFRSSTFARSPGTRTVLPLVSGERLTSWQPGVTYNGGIPSRTTIFTTVNPAGGSSDDTANINSAIASCPAGQVVKLGPGTFNISGNAIVINKSNITLRGSGPGPGSAISSGSAGPATAPGTYSALWKTDSNFFGGTSPYGLIYVGNNPQFTDVSTSIDLVADAIKGTRSCLLASVSGLSVGMLVLLDINTDNHPSVYWGNRVEAAGAIFNGSVSGTSLTINSVTQGVVAVDQFVYNANGFVGHIVSGSGTSWSFAAAGPTVTNQAMSSGFGSRRFFCRQDRSLSQIMKIAAIDVPSKKVTFETPFHMTFATQFFAQLVIGSAAEVTGVGIEDLYLYSGVGGDGNGNLPFTYCSYSWVKNVESHWCDGTGISFYGCYRCEVRDSYMHETPNPRPGGGGYLSGINSGSSECLFENNIMWCGNKVIVMRGTGGGNVVAYNYMDDAFGDSYPMSPEAGLNAGHFTTPHFELLEGNYSHQYKGDDFWGNSIYITVLRNWFSGLRAKAGIHSRWDEGQHVTSSSSAAGTNVLHFANGDTTGADVGFVVRDITAASVIPAGTTVTAVTTSTVTLSNNITGAGVGSGDTIIFTFDDLLKNYSYFDGGVTHYPYIDSWGRSCCDIQAYSYGHNIVANVLGYNGQHGIGFDGFSQTILNYENLGTTFGATGTEFDIYVIGVQSNPDVNQWIANQDATIQRDGNWDWMTSSQRWHGVGGAVGSGTPKPIPSSYYLSVSPPFFGTNPWPWVDPATGATYVLPAKARFEALAGLSPIPPGNQ